MMKIALVFFTVVALAIGHTTETTTFPEPESTDPYRTTPEPEPTDLYPTTTTDGYQTTASGLFSCYICAGYVKSTCWSYPQYYYNDRDCRACVTTRSERTQQRLSIDRRCLTTQEDITAVCNREYTFQVPDGKLTTRSECCYSSRCNTRVYPQEAISSAPSTWSQSTRFVVMTIVTLGSVTMMSF